LRIRSLETFPATPGAQPKKTVATAAGGASNTILIRTLTLRNDVELACSQTIPGGNFRGDELNPWALLMLKHPEMTVKFLNILRLAFNPVDERR
jgi:hypothetical protein